MPKQYRLPLNKAPRNEMPGPRDPRLKAYQEQQAIDRAALVLIATGKGHQEAYRIAMENAETEKVVNLTAGVMLELYKSDCH